MKFYEALTVCALAVPLIALDVTSCVAGGDANRAPTRAVSGVVVKQPAQRFSGSGSRLEERVSLSLESFKADAAVRRASRYKSHLVVDCITTQCTAIQPGEQVDLLCRISGRFFRPNVTECVLHPGK